MSKNDNIDAHWYFGGIASAGACCFTYPLDLIRVQMQAELHQISAWEVIDAIVEQRGKMGMYFGFNVSVQRQLSYAATRFGIYDSAKRHGWTDTFWHKVEAASASGLIAGFINTPVDKVNIRMRTDATKPPHLRRNYLNLMDGLKRLNAKGGIRSLFSGALPSSLRGMLMTVGQLSVYDQVKIILLKHDKHFSDNWETFFIASLIAGAISSIITTPIDVVKIILMNADYGKFRGSVEVTKAIAQLHGFKGFYKGIIPSLLRAIPQTVLTFFFYEQLRLHFGIH